MTKATILTYPTIMCCVDRFVSLLYVSSLYKITLSVSPTVTNSKTTVTGTSSLTLILLKRAYMKLTFGHILCLKVGINNIHDVLLCIDFRNIFEAR